MADVFISYSRKDRDFVARLQEALSEHQREAWLDTKDIPPTAEWLQEIYGAIEKADAFVFVISPDSALSKVCQLEIAHAIKHHKRLIPVVCREPLDKTAPEPLPRLNWLFFRDNDDFATSFQIFLTALTTDLEHVRAHTRLLTRALDWEGKGQDRSLLLRGRELMEAEAWLAASGDKEPQPTDLMRQFLLASRQGATRRQRFILGAVSMALTVAVCLALVAFYQSQVSEGRRQIAHARQLAAQSYSLLQSQYDLALLLALEANREAAEIRAPENFWRSLMKKAVFSWSGEKYEVAEPKKSLLAALTLTPQRLKCFNNARNQQVARSPDGKNLAFLDNSNHLVIYDLVTCRQITQPLRGVQNSDISLLGFSEDGNSLVFILSAKQGEKAGEDETPTEVAKKTVALWDLEKGQLRDRLLNLPLKAFIQLSPNGKLFSAQKDGLITLWNLATLEPLGNLQGNGKPLESGIWFSLDGKIAVAQDSEGNFFRWDVASQKLQGQPLKGNERKPSFIALNQDGTILATSEEEDRQAVINLWDLNRLKPIGRIFTGYQFLYGLDFSPDGKMLAGGWLSEAHLFDVPKLRPMTPSLTGHRGHVDAFFNSNHQLTSVDEMGQIILWDLTTQPLSQILTLGGEVACTSSLPNGNKVAFALFEGNLEIWDVAGKPHLVQRLHFIKDKEMKVAVTGDPASKNNQKLADTTPFDINNLAFSPDGQTLAMVETDLDYALIVRWDVARAIQIGQTLKVPCPSHAHIALGYNPSGEVLAAVSSESSITLWDVTEGLPLGEPLQAQEKVWSLAFSPNGNLLASGDERGGILLWQVATNPPGSRPLTLHKDGISSLAFSPDGRLLGSGDVLGNIILWNLGSYQPLGAPLTEIGTTFKGEGGVTDPVGTLVFSPDSKTIASLIGHKGASLWDVETQTLLGSLPNTLFNLEYPKHETHSLTFSSGGRSLVWASDVSAKILLYDVDMQSWQERARQIANRALTGEERRRYLGN